MAQAVAAWALIAVSAVNGSEMILAASFAVTSDCDGLGSIDVEDLDLNIDGAGELFNDEGDLKPGFYLWKGTVEADGVDDVAYEGVVTRIDAKLVPAWMDKHEAEPSAPVVEAPPEDDDDLPVELAFKPHYNREEDDHDGSTND